MKIPLPRALRRAIRHALFGLPKRDHLYPEQFTRAMDLPAFRGTPRLYLIAATPRCGSNFLAFAIGKNGHFGVPLEYLNGRILKGWADRFGTKDVGEILRCLIRRRTSRSGWFGLKSHWSHFAPHADGALFAPHGGLERAIFIHRHDLLDQAISFVRAIQTQQFIVGLPARGTATYGLDHIVAQARLIRRENEAWASFFQERFDRPVMNVVYEDLAADPPAGFAAIGAFLDSDCPTPITASERTRRQSDDLSAEWRRRALADLRVEDRWILEPQSW